MLLTRDFEPPDLVVATLSGVVTLRDQAVLVEAVRSAIRLVGSVRLLVRLHEFAGWGAADGVDSDRWWLRDDEAIARIAVVGLPEWKLPILTVIAQPLRLIPIRYFDNEAAARGWLQTGSTPAQIAPQGRRTAG